MRALIYRGPDDPAVTDVETPSIGPDDVLVRSHAVGICHSDFELLEGRYIIPFSYPITPGHEWAGEVVEVGSAVEGLAPGDRVVGECVVGPGGRDHFGFNISGAAAQLFKARGEWPITRRSRSAASIPVTPSRCSAQGRSGCSR